MKKFFSVICLVIFLQIFFQTNASAREIFAFNLNGVDHYVNIDSISLNRNGFSVRLNCYPSYADGLVIRSVSFYYTDHGWSFTKYATFIGTSQDFSGMVHGDWTMQKVFNISYQYYEQARRKAQTAAEENRRRQEQARRAELERQKAEAERQRLANEKRLREEAEKRRNEEFEKKRLADAKTLTEQGYSHWQNKEYEQAIDCFERAMPLKPNDAWIHMGFGIVYKEMKDYDKSIASLTKAIQLSPKYSAAYQNLANVYFDQGNYSQALENYKKCIGLNQKNSVALEFGGLCYKYLGDFENAMKFFKNALAVNKNSSAEQFIWETFQDFEKYSDAVNYYQDLLKTDKNNSGYHFKIGYSYEQLQDYKNAEKFYKKAIKIKPTANFYESLAVLYEKMNKNKKAAECREKISEIENKI